MFLAVCGKSAIRPQIRLAANERSVGRALNADTGLKPVKLVLSRPIWDLSLKPFNFFKFYFHVPSRKL